MKLEANFGALIESLRVVFAKREAILVHFPTGFINFFRTRHATTMHNRRFGYYLFIFLERTKYYDVRVLSTPTSETPLYPNQSTMFLCETL